MKRFGYFSLLCLLVLAAVMMPVSASARVMAAEWEISADGNTVLCDDGRIFYAITDSPQPLKASLYSIRYCYYNGVYLQDYYHEIYSPSRDSGLLYVSGDYDHFFVTEEAAAEYAAFLAGEEGTPILIDGAYENYRAEMSEALLAALLNANGETRNVSVGVLKNAASYTVNRESPDKAMMYTRGTVFRLSAEEYGFVDHMTLGNGFFDASGNLSLRSGELPLTILDAETAGLLQDTVEDLSYEYPQVKWYEADEAVLEEEDPGDLRANAIIFYVIYAILGFVLPAVPLVPGLICGLTRKQGKRRLRWLLPAGFAALWLLFALWLLILLLH